MLEVVAELLHFDGDVGVAERELLHGEHRDDVVPVALVHRYAAVAYEFERMTANMYNMQCTVHYVLVLRT